MTVVAAQSTRKPLLWFVVESGTDVRLVEGLADRFSVTVLARSIPGGVVLSRPTGSATTIALDVCSPGRIQFGLTVLWKLLVGKRRGRVDTIIVQGYGVAALAANLAALATRTPVVMLVCSPAEDYCRCRQLHPRDGRRIRRWELRVIQTLARLNALVGKGYVVLSEHLRDVVRGHGRRRLDAPVIPVYGVDTSVFVPRPESKANLRQQLGLPVEGAIVFFSSRIAPEKDAETIVVAIRELVECGNDVWLLNRSGGHAELKTLADRLGIGHRVLTGDAVHPHNELPDFYRASDVCVQASRAEGLGFSPLEALACEVPVIAASVGGLRETIRDEQTGWTYPPGDAVALARCIRAALADPAEAQRRARVGRALVTQRFDRRLVFQRLTEHLNLVRQRAASD